MIVAVLSSTLLGALLESHSKQDIETEGIVWGKFTRHKGQIHGMVHKPPVHVEPAGNQGSICNAVIEPPEVEEPAVQPSSYPDVVHKPSEDVKAARKPDRHTEL